MARYRHLSKKIRYGKRLRQTKWAPYWTIPKIYGQNKRIHPGRHTTVKRNWRRTKLKL